MTMTASEVIAAELQRYGVSHIFGQSIPTKLLLAAEALGIRQIFYRTENAGGAMADGYARATGSVGVVAAQNGPAATLLVPPLAEAMKASVPVIALVQEIPRATRDRNAFQEFDHEALFAACTKWIARLDCPERLEEDLALAFTHATSGRPGPVVLLLPKDVLAAPADARPAREAALGGFPLDRVRPDRRAVKRAAELLATAEAPLVIAGGGVHLSGASSRLAELQEVASLPVATTTMGKGSVDEGHELSVGVVASFMGEMSLTKSLRSLVQAADVVLLVGTRTNENGTDAWRLLPQNATLIHLDVAPEEIGRNYDSVRLAGDADAGLEDLIEEMKALDLSRRRDGRPTLVTRIATAHTRDRRDAETVLGSEAMPVRPERIMAELDDLIDEQTIVVADASYATIWSAAYLTSRRAGQRFLSPRGLAGLGWGLPMALGVQVAHPNARVVCLAGDGAFAHSWQELETAVRECLPVTIILLNNSILGFQKHGELHEFGEHTTAVEFQPVDHGAIARACGARGVRVDDPSELRSAITDALATDVPTLVEVMVDPFAHPPITAWDGSPVLEAMRVA